MYLCGLQDAVRAKLRSKLKNARYRQLQSEEDGASRKRQRTAEKIGLPHYGADSSDALPDLYRLKNPETLTAGEIRRLKEKTFRTRRFLVTKGKDPLPEMIRRFPWICEEDEVSGFLFIY